MTQLRSDQLSRHLSHGLSPVYFIHGDETLLVNECADAVRCAARDAGYSERTVLSVEHAFDWSSLAAASNSLSLFSEKRILELRLPNGKPGREGGSALCDYAARLPEETVLLVISSKLRSSVRGKKAWSLPNISLGMQ